MTRDVLKLLIDGCFCMRWLAACKESSNRGSEEGDNGGDHRGSGVTAITIALAVGHLDSLGTSPLHTFGFTTRSTAAHNPVVVLDGLTDLTAPGGIHVFRDIVLDGKFVTILQVLIVTFSQILTVLPLVVLTRVANVAFEGLSCLCRKHKHQSADSEGNLQRIHG